MADDCEDLMKCYLRDWGKWAQRDGVNRLWFLNRSPEQIDHTKYHEGDHPLEELVDKKIAELGKFHKVARDALYFFYVYEDQDGGKLGWPEVAEKMQCSKHAVMAAHKFALGFLAASIPSYMVA